MRGRTDDMVREREKGPVKSFASVTARAAAPRGGIGSSVQRRPLKTAAVTITGIADGVSYTEALKEAKKKKSR